MHALDIQTGADLVACSREFLVEHFGRAGRYYHDISRGIDERPVMASRPRKSLSSEMTFARDLVQTAEMLERLSALAVEVMEGLRRRELCARTVTIKVRYNDFRIVTRSCSRESYWDLEGVISVLPELLARTDAHRRPVRLLGVGASGLSAWQPGAARDQFELFAQRSEAPARCRE